MAVTTFEAIRDAMITALEGKVATKHAGVRFKANLAERDIAAWAESNPGACFRRFAIEGPFDNERSEATNLDVLEEVVTATVLVCYPNDSRYGPNNARDQTDVMIEDYKSTRQVIGPEGGFRSFADAAILFNGRDIEDLGAVSVHTTDLEIRYYRSMP